MLFISDIAVELLFISFSIIAPKKITSNQNPELKVTSTLLKSGIKSQILR